MNIHYLINDAIPIPTNFGIQNTLENYFFQNSSASREISSRDTIDEKVGGKLKYTMPISRNLVSLLR